MTTAMLSPACRASMRACLGLSVAWCAADAVAGSTLFVSGYDNDAVLLFDAATGAQLGALANVPGAQSVRYGPDGHIYACAEKIDRVLRFDGTTLAPLGPFVWDDPNTPIDETGGLDGPTGAVFGADGDLYVASFNTDNVLRYDGQTGAFRSVFVSTGAGLAALNGPDAGMLFGPDGHLYVPSFFNNRVNRYDAATGAFLNTVAGQTQGVSRPRALHFRSDGVLYVTSWGNGRVLRFAQNGAPLGPLIVTPTPTGLVFDPVNADVYVTSDNQNHVRVFQKDGTFKHTLIAPGTIIGGTWLAIHPNPDLTLARPAGQVGQVDTLALANGTSNGLAILLVGTATASLDTGACPPTPLGVAAPAFFAWPLDALGHAQVSTTAPASLLGVTLVLQAVEPGACRVSNLVLVTFE